VISVGEVAASPRRVGSAVKADLETPCIRGIEMAIWSTLLAPNPPMDSSSVWTRPPNSIIWSITVIGVEAASTRMLAVPAVPVALLNVAIKRALTTEMVIENHHLVKPHGLMSSTCEIRVEAIVSP